MKEQAETKELEEVVEEKVYEKRSSPKILAKRVGGIYKNAGLNYVKVVGNGKRKWYQISGSLEASYTIDAKEFDKLRDA